MNDCCQTKLVTLQENGILRDHTGHLFGRVDRNIDFTDIVDVDGWISVDDALPKADDTIFYIKWVGWINEQDEMIHRLLHGGKPSMPEVKYGMVQHVDNEGQGNYIQMKGGDSPDHISHWQCLPLPPKVTTNWMD